MRPPGLLAALLAVAIAVPAAAPALAPAAPDQPDGTVSVLRGQPSVLAALDSPGAVRAARRDGRLVQSSVAVPGDVLVARFRSTALNRAVRRADGENTTVRFFAALDATNASVRVGQVNPGVEQAPVVVDLRASDVRVVRDGPNATFWLALDTADPVLTADGEPAPDRDLRPGTDLEVVVDVPEGDDTRTLAGRVTFVELAYEVETLAGGRLGTPLYATGNDTLGIRGRTVALPGETATFRVTDANGTVVDRTVVTATARPNPTASSLEGTLSLAGVATGETFTVEVVARNRTVFERRGIVGAPPTLTNVSTAHLANGSTRISATVRYPDDGFVQVWDFSDDTAVAVGHVPARERTRIELLTPPGTFDLGDVAYVVGFWDANRDGAFVDDPNRGAPDVRWRVGDEVLGRAVSVRPSTPTPAGTREPAGTPTATVPAPGTTAPVPSQRQTGFDLGAALAALTALLGSGVWRR